jgi:uncharacterized membrane protein YcaP (DUF421 family)
VDPLAAIALRAVFTYVYLLVLVRLSGKRTIGEGTPFDFLMAIIVGDFPDDIIWGDVPVAQGVVAVGTLTLMHLLVAVLSYHSIPFDRLVGSGPVALLRQGDSQAGPMARERLNEMALDAMLRRHGIEERAGVQEGLLEPSGSLTVQRQEERRPAEKRDRDQLKETLS